MSFVAELQQVLEHEETRTVGTSFGGTGASAIYSVPRIRDWIVVNSTAAPEEVRTSLSALRERLTATDFNTLVANAVRFSFLIELTDLKVGSTKMKTRWVPGFILMPQDGSFEPIRGSFEPGNDPRSSPFECCFAVFDTYLRLIADRIEADPQIVAPLREFCAVTRVPYEFPITYIDSNADPVHVPSNVEWMFNDDAKWLAKARVALNSATGEDRAAIRAICTKKLSVKVYKTDRALTGRDKTNRAKRWEVLAGDFQHASLPECWSVERRLTEQLVRFEGFPDYLVRRFVDDGLVPTDRQVARCPVTLAPLNYPAFAKAMLEAQHGRSDYQIGHLVPLKRNGRHIGSNVSWQSADGNRIQGDLTLEETTELLDAIAARRHSASRRSAAVSERVSAPLLAAD